MQALCIPLVCEIGCESPELSFHSFSLVHSTKQTFFVVHGAIEPMFIPSDLESVGLCNRWFIAKNEHQRVTCSEMHVENGKKNTKKIVFELRPSLTVQQKKKNKKKKFATIFSPLWFQQKKNLRADLCRDL